jgi:hypothetical protein
MAIDHSVAAQLYRQQREAIEIQLLRLAGNDKEKESPDVTQLREALKHTEDEFHKWRTAEEKKIRSQFDAASDDDLKKSIENILKLREETIRAELATSQKKFADANNELMYLGSRFGSGHAQPYRPANGQDANAYPAPANAIPPTPLTPDSKAIPAPFASATHYPPHEAAPTHLYDGKPFDYWRDLWKTDLSTDRRVQAVEALSAFGRADAGSARQAAEAILDVASQYDFSESGKKLQKAVIAALTEGARPAISPDVWLPALMERIDKPAANDAAQWKKLLTYLVWRIQRPSLEVRQILYKLVDDPAVSDQVHNELVNRANALNDKDVADFARAALKNDKLKLSVLDKIGFRQLDKAPEQIDLLFDADQQVQQRAREILAYNNSTPQPELVKKLLAVLDDPQRAADHVAAIRALSAYRRQLNTVGMKDDRIMVQDRLAKIVSQGRPEQLPAALAAFAAVFSNLKFGDELNAADTIDVIAQNTNMNSERRQQALAAEDAARKELQQILPRHPGVERAD